LQMKFYSPLTADFFPNDTEDLDDDYSEYEGIPYTGKELAGYRDVIRNAIYEDVKDFYGDLMRYYREDDSVRRKVVRAVPNVDEVNGELVGSLWVDTDAPLTAEEQAVFCAYISGQYSDGWGEGFEQREIDVGDLSTFIFSLIRAVGLILLGWGIVQVGLSLQSHDPSQRSQGFLTLAGGLVITFAKEILDLITA
jgi:hypothetical protein